MVQKSEAETLFFMEAYVAIFNLKCNMQNDNAICKMALHFIFKFIFYINIIATFGAKCK